MPPTDTLVLVGTQATLCEGNWQILKLIPASAFGLSGTELEKGIVNRTPSFTVLSEIESKVGPAALTKAADNTRTKIRSKPLKTFFIV